MFKVNDWVKENLIRGYEDGVFASAYAAVLAAGFFARGVLTESDLREIAVATNAETEIEE